MIKGRFRVYIVFHFVCSITVESYDHRTRASRARATSNAFVPPPVMTDYCYTLPGNPIHRQLFKETTHAIQLINCVLSPMSLKSSAIDIRMDDPNEYNPPLENNQYTLPIVEEPEDAILRLIDECTCHPRDSYLSIAVRITIH